MTTLDRKHGTSCIVCGASIVKGAGHDAGCMAAGLRWYDSHTGKPTTLANPDRTTARPCPYKVGRRVCVAGAIGHAGPHDWPQVAR